MNINSPITEYLIEPFDSYVESKNTLNFKNMAFLQLSFIFLSISFYYYNYNMSNRSSLLYLVAYYFFFKFIKNGPNDDVKTISEIAYFMINLLIVFYIIEDKKLNLSTNIIIFTIIILTFMSYSVKFDNYIDSKDRKLNEWKKLIKTTCNVVYPINDKTKKYHTQNFWRVFDFSTLSFVIFLIIYNVKK